MAGNFPATANITDIKNMKFTKTLLFFLILTIALTSCTDPNSGFIIPPPNLEQGKDDNTQNPSDDTQTPETPETPETPVDPVPAPIGGPVIVGYATYWDTRMPDPTLLTHINYAFALIKNDFESLDVKKPERLRKIVALKSQNPNLKVVLSVGGWGAGNFSEMAADANHRKKFAENCLAAVKTYGLDGIDIDWEYPSSNSAGISASPNDISNFTLLMKDLRATLGKDRLLTIATYAGVKYYDFKNVTQYLDFVNIMTYDMGRPPYHHSALYSSSKTKNSCAESVEKHYQAGVPYGKLVLGVPFYGKPAQGESVDYVDLASSYFSTYTERWDDQSKVPYLVDATGTMVICYDNAKSLGLKADFIKSKGLLGAMYWNIEADDNNWTLSKTLASSLLGVGSDENTDDDNSNLESYQVTNEYMQKFMDEVTYNVNYKDKTTTYIKNYPGGGPGEADIPPSVTISWDPNGYTGKTTLKVWDEEWSREYSLSAGVSKQELLNLVPNSTYHYTVTGSDGTAVAKGAFKTTGSIHQVYFPHKVRNCRDLGGWKTVDGKTVVYRKLYRGGAVRIDEEGKKEWRALGIKADLDLREAGAASKSPAGSDIDFICPGFPHGYKGMMTTYASGVKDCFAFIAECLRNDKPVFIHCSAGRDRTGTIAMLTLGLLGVSEGDLGKDYELTYFSPADWSMSGEGASQFYDHTRNVSTFRGACEYVWSFKGSTFKENVEKYLLSIGVKKQDLDDIRRIMLR